MLVQRTLNETDFDVWVRIPHHQRFQKAYMDKIWQEISLCLKKKIPGVELECQEMPESYRYEYDVLGPVRFPIYDRVQLQRKRPIKGKNVFFDSPETWTRLDWTGRFDFQTKLINQIKGVQG